MRLHLLSADQLARKLASDRVGGYEQAVYLAVSFIAWLVPGYLYIWAVPLATGTYMEALWFGQFGMLILVNWAGIFHCLRQCHHQPARHFLVDFGCLYAPASVVALTVTWGAFHAWRWIYAPGADSDSRTYAKLHDLLLYFVVVGQVALIYFIVGRKMRLAADLRAAAA